MTQGPAAATTGPHADANRQLTEPLSPDPYIAAEQLAAHHGGQARALAFVSSVGDVLDAGAGA
jgi:hypothetical protein